MTLFVWAKANGVAPAQLYRWRQLVAGLDGRGIKDAAEARALLAAWGSSGRALAEWCRAEKVSMEALSQWQRRVEASGRVARSRARPPGPVSRRPASPIRLVEVTLPRESTAEPVSGTPTTARYEVHVGRCRVLIDRDFDDAELARLLRVAAAC
ncbi:MAG: hypothetical protein EXR69_15260 [Myxococcales bacterium]|nr:hypothetical protein [Myxococcales bacterium]